MVDTYVKIGDDTNSNHGIEVQIDGEVRTLRYNSTSSSWEFTDNGTSYNSIGAGSSFDSSSDGLINAYSIEIVDLDDPIKVWDHNLFTQLSRNTSWHTELGPPPVHGILYVNGAKTAVVWHDRVTGVEYMRFTAASNNLIEGSVVNDARFIDGFIYVAHETAGVYKIDLLIEKTTTYSSSDVTSYRGDISDRNGAKGSDSLSLSDLYLHDSDVDYIAGFCRDGSTTDSIGRPKHFWCAHHNQDATSLYSPTYDQVFNEVDINSYHCHLSSDFRLFSSQASDVRMVSDVRGISADNWNTTNGVSLGFGSYVTQNFQRTIKSFPRGNAINPNWPVLIGIDSDADAGMHIVHLDLDDYTKSGKTQLGGGLVPQQYTKGMSNSSTVAFSCGSSNKRTNGVGRNSPISITENGDVTHPAGVLRNCSYFDGSSYWSDVETDTIMHSTSPWTVACWVRSGSDTLPSTSEYVWAYWDSNSDHCARMFFTSSGYIYAELTDDGFSSKEQSRAVGNFYDGKWHHVVVVFDQNNLGLWIDGTRWDNDPISVVTSGSGDNVDYWYIGALNDLEGNFTGYVDQYSMSKNAWTENEVHFSYAMGVHSIGASPDQEFLSSRPPDPFGASFNPHSGQAIASASGDAWEINPNGVIIDQSVGGGSTDRAISGSWPVGATQSHIALGQNDAIDIFQSPTSAHNRRNSPPQQHVRNIIGPTKYYGPQNISSFDAIVSSDGSGTHTTVQSAISSGAKNIKIKRGQYNIPSTISGDEYYIEGSGRGTVISNTEDLSSPPLTVTGDFNTITQCGFTTTSGGAGGGESCMTISGNGNIIKNNFFIESDSNCITLTGTENIISHNSAEDADNDFVNISSAGHRNQILFNQIKSDVAGYAVNTDSSNHINVMGNIIQGSSNSINFLLGDKCIAVYNVINSSIVSTATNSTISDNEEY